MVQGNTEQVQTTHSWLPRGSNQHAAMQYLLDSADGLPHDLQKYCNTRMIKKHSINQLWQGCLVIVLEEH